LASQVAQRAAVLVSEALATEGVRRQHFSVLTALSESGGISQAELGRRVWIDRSDLHALLAELEGDGLVARKPDPEDRRRNVVTLTAVGVRKLRRLDARVQAAQETLLEPLTPAQRETFVRLLRRLAGPLA
jgi:DNA-binding MarR family transcriptional regulator